MFALLNLPRFSLETLPTILLITLIIVLFAALLWFVLSKLPEPVGTWARWIAIVIGGILLLWFLTSLIPGSVANAQTTRPALQIEVQHRGKAVKVIVPTEVAGRIANGTQTDEDRATVQEALQVALGDLGGPQKPNPCHPKPSAVTEGRFPTNCSDSIEPRRK